jgi:hypothetical protein
MRQSGCMAPAAPVVNRRVAPVPYPYGVCALRRAVRRLVRGMVLCAAGGLLWAGAETASRAGSDPFAYRLPGWVRTASAQAAPQMRVQPEGVVASAPEAARPRIVLPSAGPGGSDLVLDPPAWPEDRDLALLQQGVRPDLRFFVDRRSLELLPDGEIRYVFVVRTPAGASNVTWEAMRCDTRDRIILAIGSVDRRWSAARFPRWESLDRNDASGMRGMLHRDIFCPGRQAPLSLRHLQAALKTGLPAGLVPD